MAIAHATSPGDAARGAKRLIGSYAFLKTHDPDGFAISIAAVLAQYPHGLVEECCDPRVGMARTVKFLSVAELVTWLDSRLEHHRILAAWRPRPEARVLLPPPVRTPEHRAGMVERFRALLAKMTRAPDPVTTLIRAHKRQAEQRLAADKARALAGTDGA